MIRKVIPLALALALLAACGSPTTTDDGAAASPAPAQSPAASPSPATETSPSPAPSPSPDAAAGPDLGSVTGEQAQILTQALGQLATQANVDVSNFRVESFEEEEWSDGSLGCPDPATMYTQAIVPGYKVVVSDGSRTYDLHASQEGRVIWCDARTPRQLN